MAQTGYKQTQNYQYNNTYPMQLFAQQAWASPLALGNLLGQYLAGVYMDKNTPKDTGATQQTTTPVNAGDFQSTLNSGTPKGIIDDNGNWQYQSPSFTPGVDYAPIQAPETFKDFYNGTRNGQGLLNFDQLAQAAGITPESYARTLSDSTTPRFSLDANGNAQYHAPTAGFTVPSTGMGTTLQDYTANPTTMTIPTADVQPTGNSDIPAITGQLGQPINGQLTMSLKGDSPFSGGWQYNGAYSPKNYGDIAQMATISPNSSTMPSNKPMYTIDSKFPGMIKEGNIDIANRPVVHLQDGSIATVRSIGVNLDGKEYLLPTVSEDGRLLDKDQAVEEFKRTGKYLGIFDSPEASDRYAEALHNQQDQMYSIEENKDIQPIQDTSPIKAVEPPIKELEQPIQAEEPPIKEEQPPITEEKKEVLDGKKLRILSANDGNMYNFTISDDGKWMTLDGSNARYAAADKDRLIAALHNLQQSPIDIEEMGTSTHNNVIQPSKEDAALIAKDPKLYATWRAKMNNQDARNMNDTSNPGIYPDVHIGMPTANAMQNNSAQGTGIGSNEPHPFKAQQAADDYVRTMLNRGFNMNAINERLQTYLPEWEAKEADYNNYQVGNLLPLYYNALQGEEAGKLPWGTSATIAQAIRQYDSSLGDTFLGSQPTASNFYASADAQKRAAQAQQYAIDNAKIKNQYDKERNAIKYANDVNMQNLKYKQNVSLKQIQADLDRALKEFSTNEKLRYDRTTAADRYNMLVSHGADAKTAAYGAYGISAPKSGGSGRSSGSGGSKDGGMTFSQAKGIITNYESWKKDNPDSPDSSFPLAAVLPRAQTVINNSAVPELADEDRNDYNKAMSWATSLIEANGMQGNPYSMEQIEQTIRDNLDPGIADSVINDSYDYMEQWGLKGED